MVVRSLAYHLASATVKCLGQGSSASGNCDTGLPKVDLNSSAVQTIMQYTFGIVGAIAILFILIAAMKFVTSSGDPQGAAKARQTIIYAAVGLLVAVLAEVIVTFVLNIS